MKYIIKFEKKAQEQLLFWQKNNKKIADKISKLLEDIQEHPFSGIGKPEALKNNWSGYWSRRINKEHRLIYKIENDKIIIVIQCKFHYK